MIIHLVLKSGFMLLAMVLLIFPVAGDWYWQRGWSFFFLVLVTITGCAAYLYRVNPEIIEVRKRLGAGTKRWDLVLLLLISTTFITILPVASLDHRHGIGNAPAWLVPTGYALFILANALIAWCEAVNSHFEVSVRLQSDRDHQVVSTGSYAVVRHPGYVALSIMAVAVALSLQSYCALVPAAVCILLNLIRTFLEDAMLKEELEGYREYAERTRWRWIPWIF